MIVLFNKPFNVLSQFTDTEKRSTLKDFLPFHSIYPAGRLDRDSEGLILLTDNGRLQHLISDPKYKFDKEYWVQVEGEPDQEAINTLSHGVQLKDGMTSPAKVETLASPSLWPRTPPIRHRANIPTSWLRIELSEGKNRQLRRMTAAVGFPTLRLVRVRIGPWRLGKLQPGEYRQEDLNIEQLPVNWRKMLRSQKKSNRPR